MSPRRVRRRDDAPEPVRETAASAYEFHDGEQWLVRPVTGERAVKAYRCPGCDQEIPAGTPHVVAWAVDRPDERRHWHRPCWAARDRRGTRVQRSRSAPRHG